MTMPHRESHVEQTIVTPERPASQLRAIYRHQIACALGELVGADDQVPASVHGARKQLKKARATLKLLRPSLGDEIYRRENVVVRDAARPLSGMRDAEVLLATFDQLATKQGQHEGAADLLSLRRALVRHVRGLAKSRSVSTDDIAQFRDTLSAARRRASRWTLRADDWDHVCLGLMHTYRRGRAEGAAARKSPTTEHLHDWRKRAKYLWHQLQILAPIAPGEIGELADQFHRLSDYLGDEHDLAVLEDTVSAMKGDIPRHALAWFAPAVEVRRSRLREKAFTLGNRLYDAKSARLATRFDLLWNKWRNNTTDRPKTSVMGLQRRENASR